MYTAYPSDLLTDLDSNLGSLDYKVKCLTIEC